jgi:signal transduction histidine kinase
MHHDSGMLVAMVQVDGIWLDPAHAETGAGLINIRDRIERLGDTVKLTSNPGHGTVVAIALPWPAKQGQQTMPNATSQANRAAASND